MKHQHLIPSVVLTLLGASLAARADVVLDWNNSALTAIRTAKTAPPPAPRNLAILHAAIYDAVNGIKGPHEQRFQPYLLQQHGPPQADQAAAASAAAHMVLVSLWPSQQARFDAEYDAVLATLLRGKPTRDGIAYGELAASTILAARASDGSANTVVPPSGSGPGVWMPTPPAFAPYLLPQWGSIAPFCMTSSAQFRPSGPPALDSAQWAADYNEVKALGAAVGSTRTPDQTEIALFWADGSGTETPPGHWNSIAQEIAIARGNTVDENARLFALLNLAMADAAICAWDAKSAFNFWRPVTAIRNGDTDGNPATDPDPACSSFIVTPPFPDYVSGHSTFSAASATVLALFCGTDDIAFTTGSDFLPGISRSFTTFSAAAEEAAMSRLYGGIHFRAAAEDGLSGGASIGEWTFTHYLQRKGHRPRG
jgi:membrane-associated phospholipid phosphatase